MCCCFLFSVSFRNDSMPQQTWPQVCLLVQSVGRVSSHLPVIADVDTSYVASVPELAPLWTWAELTYVHSHPFLQAHPDGGDVGSVSISLLWRCENPVWIRQPYEFSVMGCNWACPGLFALLIQHRVHNLTQIYPILSQWYFAKIYSFNKEHRFF